MKTLTALIVLVLLSCQITYSQTPKVIDRIAAVVGEKIILQSDIEQQKLQAVQAGVDIGENGECEILESLLFESLLAHQADLDSVEVGDEQVEIELDNRIRYFKRMLNEQGMTLEDFYGKSIAEIKEDFRELIRDRMKSEEMQRKISGDIQVTPRDVREYFNSIPKDSLPLVDAQIEIAHIVIKPEISEDIKLKARKKLEGLREQIVKGEKSFSVVVTFNSDDPGTKGTGGEFDFVSPGEFVPEFDAMAGKIEVGEVSPVFKTDYGYHILELLERVGERYRGRHVLIMPKVSAEEKLLAIEKLDSVVKLIRNGDITFEAAALKYSDDADTKNNKGKIFNRNTGSTLFNMKEIDGATFVTVNKMEPGDVSDPIRMTTDDGKDAHRILKLLARTKPHVANLEQDYQMIQNAALNQKRGKAIEGWSEKTARKTYIRVTEDYQTCDFKYPWGNEGE